MSDSNTEYDVEGAIGSQQPPTTPPFKMAPKVNTYGIDRKVPVPVYKEFTDKEYPGELYGFCLMKMDNVDAHKILDTASRMQEYYLGFPDATPPIAPTGSLPPIDEKGAQITYSFLKTVATVFHMQSKRTPNGDRIDPEDRYSFEEMMLLAIKRDRIWRDIMVWVTTINQDPKENDGEENGEPKLGKGSKGSSAAQ